MSGHVRGDVRKAAAEVVAPVDGADFIKRLIGAWDCCGTCAGGVLAQRDAAQRAEGYEEGSRRRMDYATVYGYELGREEGAKDERERIARAIEADAFDVRWRRVSPALAAECAKRAARIARTVDQ